MNTWLRVSATSTRQITSHGFRAIHSRWLHTTLVCPKQSSEAPTASAASHRECVPTIGLELHVQLKSPVKLFSNAPTSYEDVPNSQVALLDAAIPGTLPVLNPEPVRLALLAALALGCQINRVSKFDRKHYFYPDLPAGYQITQKYSALAQNGRLQLTPRHDGTEQPVDVRISQIQLEQDTAKSTYDSYSSQALIDLNRAGTALIEIISEPDMHSSAEAAAYVRKVQKILRTTGASDADMEKGSLRIDVNVSVAARGEERGTRCEIKNLNSVRSMVDAIEYERERHTSILLEGGSVEQQTRGFDATTETTTFLRSKADTPDYRYMPDPELAPLVIPASIIEELRIALPEMPDAKRERLERQYGLPAREVDILVRIGEGEEGAEGEGTGAPGVAYFEELSSKVEAADAAKWIIHELLGHLSKHDIPFSRCPIAPSDLASLITQVKDRRLTNTVAKRLLADAVADPNVHIGKAIAAAQAQSAGSAGGSIDLGELARRIIDSMPQEAEKYRKGKKAVLARLIGQGMKETKGAVDASALGQKLQELLSKT